MARTEIIAGLAAGIGFMIILQIALWNHSTPPDMFMIVDGKRYKAGYGSYSGTDLDGSHYGADVDSSRTLPQGTINATRGSEIQFLSPAQLRPVLRQAWILEKTTRDQFFLEQVNDNTFRIADDAIDGEYVLSVQALYRSGLITASYYDHKIRIS